MLRFRTETVYLGLCRDQVGGLRPGRAGAAPLAPLHYQPAGPPGDMAPTLAALDQYLGQYVCGSQGQSAGHRTGQSPGEHQGQMPDQLPGRTARRRRVHVVVSTAFVRCALIPWTGTPLNAEEDALMQGARFEQLYGDMRDWRIRADAPAYGAARLACAVPLQLELGMAALWRAHGVAGGVMVPYFAACWNRWYRHVGRRPGLLAVVEREHVVLGRFGRNGWHSVRSVYAEAGAGALRELLLREQLLQDLPPDLPVWVHHAGAGAAPPCAFTADEADAVGTPADAVSTGAPDSGAPSLGLAAVGAGR